MKQLVNFFGRQAKNQVQEPPRKPSRRQLRSESLEKRQLLAGDLLPAHNYSIPEDVNGDFQVTPLDALLILNHIRRSNGVSSLEGVQRGDLEHFVDVTATNEVTPLDALRVMNHIARGEALDPLLDLRINPRTRDDEAFSASAFNAATRELTVGVNEVFNLELLYTDLRGSFDRLGAFAIYSSFMVDTGNVLEPVLTETQFLEVTSNLRSARAGTVTIAFEDAPTETVVINFDDFAADSNAPAREIRSAIEQLGYSDVTVTSLTGADTDPFNYLIRFNDFDLAGQNLPNLVFTANLTGTGGVPVPVTGTVTDEPPLIPVDEDNPDVLIINPQAIPLNLNFESRTFKATALNPSGEQFYGFAGTQVGSFDPAVGFINVGSTGPLLVNGFPDANAGALQPNFDVFSIPVRMNQPFENLRIQLDPPSTSATQNLFFGSPNQIPNDLVQIILENDPNNPNDGTGLLYVTAVSDGAVTVSAGNGTLAAAQTGPNVPIDLSLLVTVQNGEGFATTYALESGPGFGSVAIDSATGLATFTPSPLQSGTTSFVYSATVNGVTDTGTVTLNVSPLVVTAGDGSVGAVQNGDPVNFNLADFVTAPGSAGLTPTFVKVSDPSLGSVTVQPDGAATYTPAQIGFGPTTFDYSVTIGGVTDTGTITVNVSALPVSVVAGDGSLDAVQGGPDVTLELNGLVTITNGDGLPRSFVILDPPAFGSAVVNPSTGQLTYTPPTDAFGATTLDYSVTVNGATDTGTISIDVARQPVVLAANPGSLTAFQNGTPVQINLNNLISVTPAGTQVTFELILPNPTLGTAVLGANGVVTYTPSATQSGVDSFGYSVTSLGDDVQVAESTVSVTVNEEITITAGDDQFEAIEGGAPIVINPFPGSLVQTTGPAATPTITLNTSGLQGNVEFSGGVLTYTPPAVRFGTDSFSYTASLAAMPGFAGASDQGVITITEVASITARDSSITALPGDPAQVINLANLVTVTGTDDLPEFTLDTTGLAGTAVPNGNTVTYTPPDTEFGTTSFSYTATVAGKSATATVTISEGVSIETSPGSLVSFPGGPPVTLSLPTLVTISGSEEAPIYALATAPSIGSAEVNPSTGLLTYTPPATGPIGQISFTYRVTVEGISVTDTVTVTELTVVAPDRTLTVDEAQPNVTPPGTTLQLSATVSVALPAAFTIVSPPSLGTATIVGNVLTYTPRAFDFDQTVFTDSIVYQAAVNGVSDTGTIAITINPTVLPPVAVADSVNAVADTFTTYTSAQLTQNDSPARPNPSGLRPVVTDAAAIPGVTAGTVVFNAADNSVTFTPAPTFVGETSFNYTMTSEGQTSTATVTVNVREFVPSTISGSIFTDYIESVSNPVRNGVRDANEPAMGGVPVRLTSPASQNLFGQDIDQLVLTDAEGGYVFDDVPPGIYEVSFETPDTLVFGASSNGSSLPAQVSGQTFTLEVGPDGGLTYSGMNFTVLGRKGLAAGTGTLLVSQYLLSSPNSPYNSSRPDFGLATMIVNPSNGTQQVFELAQGFDGVVFAEIAVGRSGNTALLTLIMEDATVKTALLSKDNGDFVINSTRAVIQVFRNVSSMNFIGSAADVLEAEYGNYREAVDQVLAAGMF